MLAAGSGSNLAEGLRWRPAEGPCQSRTIPDGFARLAPSSSLAGSNFLKGGACDGAALSLRVDCVVGGACSLGLGEVRHTGG